MKNEARHKSIGIYGFGRFGRFWANELKHDFDVYVWNKSDKKKEAEEDGLTWVTKKKLLEQDVIILCMPINAVESVVKDIVPFLRSGQVIMDTFSVKEMPVRCMQKYIPKNVKIVATHPMFGPDSGKNGLQGLRMVYYPVRVDDETMNFWKKYWQKRGLEVIEMTPEEHDKLAAYSQGVAHYLARVLQDMELKRTPIDVQGFSALMDMKDVLGNDTWELFNDLQQNNRFTKQMRIDFIKSMKKIYYRLFPPRVHPRFLVFGVQGAKGSYSEIACKTYCDNNGIGNYKIKYLINATPVLKALYHGDIDFGIIAIQNAQGGMVTESIEALSEFNAHIHEIFGIVINHCVLVKPGAKKVSRIISHEQALKQCTQTLRRVCPGAILEPFKDTALAAKKLAEGEFDDTTAVLAPETAAEYYGLEILHNGVQDLGKDNITDFLVLSSRL